MVGVLVRAVVVSWCDEELFFRVTSSASIGYLPSSLDIQTVFNTLEKGSLHDSYSSGDYGRPFLPHELSIGAISDIYGLLTLVVVSLV